MLGDDKKWTNFIANVPHNKQVYLTVANYGYLDMLLNLYYSFQTVVGGDRGNFVVLTPDMKLIKALKIYPCIQVFHVDYSPWCGGNNVSSGAVSFKRDDWNAITRFKLLAIKRVLDEGRPVFYVDPDIVFVQDPAPFLERLRSDTLYLQQGTPYCTGVIYVHPQNRVAGELFEPDAWMNCGQDDETYMKVSIRYQISKRKVSEHLFQTFNFKLFPNGLMWKDKLDEGIAEATRAIAQKECVLFHFNHIAGLENKIERMQTTKAFHYIMRIADVPEKFRPALDEVCVDRTGSTYPPHHQGDHLEEACERIVRQVQKKRIIASPYTYLPIHWTAIAVSKNQKLLADLREWCAQFFSTHKKEAFWTVVQHCKGLYGSCGVTIPQNTKLFLTSDPRGALMSVSRPVIQAATVTCKPPPPQRNKRASALKQYNRTQHKGLIEKQPTAMDLQRVLKHHKALQRVATPLKQTTPTPKRSSKFDTIREQHIKMRKPQMPRQTQRHYQHHHQRRKRATMPIASQQAVRKLPKIPALDVENKWITVPLVSGKHIQNKPKIQRTILASFMGNIDIHPLRQRLKNAFAGVENTVVQSGAYRDYQDVIRFQDLMRKSVFALCPRGFGTTSFRLTEAMDYGCIPVYISDTFSIPFEELIDIQDVCVMVTSDQVDKLPKKLQNIPQHEIDRLRENIKKYRDQYFTMEGCCRTILCDYIDGGDQ